MLGRFGSKAWDLFSRFAIFMMNLLLKPFHKKLTDEQIPGFLQFCRFALVGVSNTLVSAAINLATVTVLKHTTDFGDTTRGYCGNTLAFLLSVLWAFYWSNKFVFKAEDSAEERIWWKTLLKSYAAYAFTGLGISNLISTLCINQWGETGLYIAIPINIVISVPINFVLNKFWAYGERNRKSKETDA